MSAEFGCALPRLTTRVPGPRSHALAQRLERVESPNITRLHPLPPIFWERARGANVEDVDGNIFVDLTAGFSVAAAGHAAPPVADAIAAQAQRLPHALGDVYPARVKVELLEKLASIAPGNLQVGILGSSGSEAVEAALKTALLRTGRPEILVFDRSYHGLTYGALAVTRRVEFRLQFETQLYHGVHALPFPMESAQAEFVLREVHRLLDQRDIGAVLIEPIQGRGGIRVPAAGLLEGLRDLCDGSRTLLILDEIYTGFGRTGRWFACDHSGVVPDLLLLGKALSGALPLSVCLGTPEVMSCWPPSQGEALHTSTFLGNPVACAAALAHITAIQEQRLVERAASLGRLIENAVRDWPGKYPIVAGTRGRGALQAIEFVAADPPIAVQLMDRLLADGVLVLPEGVSAEVLALTPPLVITDQQLRHALRAIETQLEKWL